MSKCALCAAPLCGGGEIRGMACGAPEEIKEEFEKSFEKFGVSFSDQEYEKIVTVMNEADRLLCPELYDAYLVIKELDREDGKVISDYMQGLQNKNGRYWHSGMNSFIQKNPGRKKNLDLIERLLKEVISKHSKSLDLQEAKKNIRRK